MRTAFRFVFDAIAFLVTLPFWLPVRLAALVGGALHKRVFQSGSQTVALFPGDLGNLLRRAFYRVTLEACDARSTVCFGTILSSPRARIGAGVYIGAYCSLGEVTIEDDCLLGSMVTVLSGKMTHRFDRTDIPMRMQGGEVRRVTLHADCWLGNGSIVMVDIPSGVVVGAGAVVTKTPEPGVILGGNPAREIGRRAVAASATRP
ncbi:MAG: hypothetical protein IT355_12660 [Gemmatimonadaceae bacterium]|nr:hypothetical protein [Gemmatimonadaceae bacterium]